MGAILPIIGYDNLLEQGTVTAANWTDEENCFDWLTYDVATSADNATCTIETDIGSTVSADYMAFHGHTLGTVSIAAKLEYWTGAAYADVPGAAVTPTDDTTQFITFTSVSATKFRFSLTTTGTAVTIAVLSFGDRLELERGVQTGFTPGPFSRIDMLLPATSEGGQFLGRSLIRSGGKGTLPLNNITEQWLRSSLDPFLIHTQTKGWFLRWNENVHPDESAYCITTKTPVPAYSQQGHMTCKIEYNSLVE